MKLANKKEIADFIKTIKACRHDIFMKINDKVLNLKDEVNLFAGIGHLVEDDNDAEIYANCREDEFRLVGFICGLSCT